MSIKLMAQVWERKLSKAEQSVLLAMADHAQDDGTRCYPSVDWIAWKTDYSARQVQRTIKELCARGVLLTVRGYGRGRPVEYRIVLSKTEAKPEYTPKGDTVSPQSKKGDMVSGNAPKGDMVSPKTDVQTGEKGDIGDVKGDINAIKGDIAMSPEPIEPLIEPTTEEKKEDAGATPAPPDTEWPKFLQSLCWICHGHEDLKALTEKQLGALTAEGKKIRDDGYAISDLSQWMKQHWFKDWRWKKDRQRPEPHTVRSSIPILRDTEPSTSGYRVDIPDVEFMPDVHPLQPAQNGHSPPPLPHDDPWAVCLAELNITLASGFLPMLTGSRIEEAGLVNRDDGSRVALYRLILLPERASSGLDHFAKQALPEIRKKLSSLLGHRVLLEIAAHQETAP